MSEDAKENLRNVIVLAIADGKLADEEKAYIESLRQKLGVDKAEFAQLCEEVRGGRRRIDPPQAPAAVEEALSLLVGLAVADGEVSAVEQKMLRNMARQMQVSPARIDEMIARTGEQEGVDSLKMQRMTSEIYDNFTGWDEPTRKAKVKALAELGRRSMAPLVRILESYRTPKGAADGLALKVCVDEALAEIGDSRCLYYLALQVNVGDVENEISNFELRAASAEAIGKIIGKPFTRDQAGVAAVREWWQSEGGAVHGHLVY